jgi:hypothetical protein
MVCQVSSLYVGNTSKLRENAVMALKVILPGDDVC